jgi:hypothetical protein
MAHPPTAGLQWIWNGTYAASNRHLGELFEPDAPSAFGWRLRASYRHRRISTEVRRVPFLGVVGEGEVRAVTAAGVKGAVSTKGQITDRVVAILLAQSSRSICSEPSSDRHSLAGGRVAH